MTKIEEKSLNTQIKLLNEIEQADHMILYSVCINAAHLMQNVVKDKIYIKEGQKTVELTVEEFNEIRLFLARLSNSKEGLPEIDRGYAKRYIDEKAMKLEILNQLQ